MKKVFVLLTIASLFLLSCREQKETQAQVNVELKEMESPMRLAVAGVTHGHLAQVRIRIGRGDFEVVGVSEPDERYLRDNDLTGLVSDELFYSDLEKMLDETKPEVVVAYGSAKQHLEVVRACAPRGIHVMVEKPLATTVKDALEMQELAAQHGILVLTNYETTWYATNTYVKKSVDEGKYGKICRIEVMDGHIGPIEIGCDSRFTDWLTDPEENGAGALYDFGCYGANLATWIFDGKLPRSVQAVLRQNKPEVYPKVDDDATVLVEYDDAVVQICASWSWSFGRKDMWVYGLDGSVYQADDKLVIERDNQSRSQFEAPALEFPYNDSFYWLKAAVRGQIQVLPSDQQALENNITVMRILEAAKLSASSGKAVRLAER